MQAKEPFVDYVANPRMLTISVLKNGIMDVLENFAKMNLIRITENEIDAETPIKSNRAWAAKNSLMKNKSLHLGKTRSWTRDELYE